MNTTKSYRILCLSSLLSILHCFVFFYYIVGMFQGYEDEATIPSNLTRIFAASYILIAFVAFVIETSKYFPSITLCSTIGLPLTGLATSVLIFTMFFAGAGPASVWLLVLFGPIIILCLFVALITGIIMDITKYLSIIYFICRKKVAKQQGEANDNGSVHEIDDAAFYGKEAVSQKQRVQNESFQQNKVKILIKDTAVLSLLVIISIILSLLGYNALPVYRALRIIFILFITIFILSETLIKTIYDIIAAIRLTKDDFGYYQAIKPYVTEILSCGLVYVSISILAFGLLLALDSGGIHPSILFLEWVLFLEGVIFLWIGVYQVSFLPKQWEKVVAKETFFTEGKIINLGYVSREARCACKVEIRGNIESIYIPYKKFIKNTTNIKISDIVVIEVFQGIRESSKQLISIKLKD